MGSRQVLVVGLVLSCVWLGDARSLSAGRPAHLGEEEAELAAGPEEEPSTESSSQASGLEEKQNPSEPEPGPELLSWKFPEHPVDPVKTPPHKFQVQQPVLKNRAAVRCGENRIQVEVSQNLLGRGKLVQPEEIQLGGCPPTEVDALSQVLVFESELHECGSRLLMKEDSFVYVFTLVYQPNASGRSLVLRSPGAVIGLECHYLRKHLQKVETQQRHPLEDVDERRQFACEIGVDRFSPFHTSSVSDLGGAHFLFTLTDVPECCCVETFPSLISRKQTVSSRPLNPAWGAFRASEAAEGRLFFSLQLRTDDWSSERPSSEFPPGGVINMEASLTQHRHRPFRVVVDRCAATSRDPPPRPPQDFVRNHGCLGGPNSPRSRFLPQSRLDVLRFQVDTTSFHGLKTVFITCRLKAIPASSAGSTEHKVCSHDQSRWTAPDGTDQLCSCCASTCGLRRVRHLDEGTVCQRFIYASHVFSNSASCPPPEEQWEAEVTLGPITVHQDPFTFSL
ncbi:zona pellucida sperm-binding protein 3-like [Antennarius striatus]|uniref:zona pellucida sperm-binding protein 3-like n=1 Tax=Antennarius striatus TaxID=241820 RepID=UPI0035AF49ED